MVRVTSTEPDSECEFLGDITGNQGNLFTSPFISNENLETGERNDLKQGCGRWGQSRRTNYPARRLNGQRGRSRWLDPANERHAERKRVSLPDVTRCELKVVVGPKVGRFWPILRVGEGIAALTPHRPERAQLTHSVLQGTGLHTIRSSDGQFWAMAVDIL